MKLTCLGLKKHAQLRDEIIEPLKKQNVLLCNRIKEYEFIKNIPRMRVDIFTVCTKEQKIIEKNNLMAKINDASTQLLTNTIQRAGKPLNQHRETMTNLKDTHHRIVYDYAFGKDKIEEAQGTYR